MTSTFMAKPQEVQRQWLVLDAAGKPLGRLATEAARILRGKHKAIFTPHVDTGDYVIVINADKIVLTGKKMQQKLYTHYSGFPGGLKVMNYEKFIATRPDKVVEKAIKGMLPHNRLGRAMGKKLKVYAGETHPHAAQQPKPHTF
ncbi:MAG: 50S ribosomal protein L13 [Chloroflexota bacterium]